MPKPSVLDDLSAITEIDKKNMLSFCVDAAEHYIEAAKLAGTLTVDFPKPKNIIVAGMGGSAIGGELLKDWARDKVTVPIEVCREYSLPAFADRQTLVFVLSYSGETEETLSVFLDALKRKSMIACLSSGGTLREFAKKLNVPHLLVPPGIAPRATLPYLFLPLPIILEKLDLVSDVAHEVSEAVKALTIVSGENSPGKPQDCNFSKTLASAINGTVPITYGSGFYRAVAQRFKTQFNENSKVPAKWEVFPELNHNEIVGWEAAGKLARHFSAIFIRDDTEPTEIRRRIELTEKLVHEQGLKVFQVRGLGKSKLAKMCSAICIGDFTSTYLALLHGIDPTPVRTIEVMKDRLKKNGVKAKIVRELQELS